MHPDQTQRTVAIEKVTPEMAQDLLDNQHLNRNVKTYKTDEWVEHMNRGTWYVTGQGLTIDWDGRLVDGQHRCKAVIKHGAPVEMIVVRGVDPDIAAFVFDKGSLRSSGDSLTIAGMNRGAERAAAYRLYKNWLDTQSFSGPKSRVFDMDVIDFCQKYEDEMLDAVQFGDRAYRTVGISRSAAGAAYFMCAQRATADDMEDFEDGLVHSLADYRYDPLLTVSRRIKDLTTVPKGTGKPGPSWQLALILKGWNNWVREEEMRVARYTEKESPPMPEPTQARIESGVKITPFYGQS